MNKIWTPKIILPDILTADARLAASKKALEVQLKALSEAALECLFLPRLDVLPEYMLDLLAEQYHVDFYEPLGMSIEVKRDFLRNAILWHRFKGTPAAVETVLSRAFSKTGVKEWFEYGGEPYFFRIVTDISSDDENTDRETLNRLRKAVFESKNARSWLEYYSFVLDSEDSLAPTDDQKLLVVPDLYDRYEYRRQGVPYDGSARYDGATMHGWAQAWDFEELTPFEVRLTHGDDVTIEESDPLRVTLSGLDDTVPAADEYTALPILTHVETVAVEENNPLQASLSVADDVAVDDSQKTTIVMNGLLDTLVPYDDARVELAQIYRYDGRHTYGGLINYGATVEGDAFDVTEDEDQRQWAILQRELELSFDEHCTCGAAEYEWYFGAIRLGEEQFLQSDPQLVTLKIECGRCGNLIAEYILPSEEWEAIV